jgi:hypothetical protein
MASFHFSPITWAEYRQRKLDNRASTARILHAIVYSAALVVAFLA